jgi:hydroxyacyl-ACP dehydratase HTD2-like protein with hotdog domain
MPRQVSFSARAPLFVNRRLWLTGSRAGDGTAEMAAVRADHVVAMTLEAR